MTSDLLVCGSGPAGRALAHRALAKGLSVTVIDPQPQRRWPATYAAWADELPDWTAAHTIAAAIDRPVAWTTRRVEIDRRYVVFDTTALQDSLDLTGARLIPGRVAEIVRAGRSGGNGNDLPSVRLESGQVLPAGRIIDARGVARAPARAEQTAFGVVVARDRWPDDDTLFMDWRDDNGAAPGEPRSFLYTVPLGPDTVLLEETCLAGRPALEPKDLRERLTRRLRARGLELTGAEPVERVRFPVQGGRPRPGMFGAAGAFTHPATGYSVATALRTADQVLLGESPWTPGARGVRVLRLAGLRALLALEPADLPVFFDRFFELPIPLQRAYLSGRDDLPGTVHAMSALFAALPWRLRARLARSVTGPG
ncbi:lycopene cyclase family protein [Nocardia sp. NPDC005978]|uniref:lycopene cyclase family protein n=1 Tax=Nocardia sp. NPDC005978 TaxID=3156725 RepID=UPI0033BB1678